MKEEKIIQNGQDFICGYSGVENEVVKQYEILLKNYKKLFKQYNKIVKLGDNYSNKVMQQNDKFKDFAKKTIINSVSTKKEIQQQYNDEISHLKKQNENLQFELEDITIKYNKLLRTKAKLLKTRYINKHDV